MPNHARAFLTVASGSWGDIPCGVSADVYSSTALEVSLSPPVTATGWTPTSVCHFSCVLHFFSNGVSSCSVCCGVEHKHFVSPQPNICINNNIAIGYYHWPHDQYRVLHSCGSGTAIVCWCQSTASAFLSDAVVHLAQLFLFQGCDVSVPIDSASTANIASDTCHQ